MRNPATTPWGTPLSCREVTPGVFCVNTPTQTGIMVRDDLVSTTCSSEALKYGFQTEGYYCFEGYNNSYIVMRELLDKGLFQEPQNRILKPGEYSAAVDRRLREQRPEYWRARQQALMAKEAIHSTKKISKKERER